MRHLGAWISGGLGSAGLRTGLSHLKSLLQPKYFYNTTLINSS